MCQVRGQFRKGTPLEGSDLFELKLYVCVLDPVGVPDVEVVVFRFVLGRVGRDLVDIDVHRGDPMGGRGDDLLPGDTGLFFELAQTRSEKARVLGFEVAAGEQPFVQGLVLDHEHAPGEVDDRRTRGDVSDAELLPRGDVMPLVQGMEEQGHVVDLTGVAVEVSGQRMADLGSGDCHAVPLKWSSHVAAPCLRTSVGNS